MGKTLILRVTCFLIGALAATQTSHFPPRSTHTGQPQLGFTESTVFKLIEQDLPMDRYPYAPDHPDHRQQQLPGDPFWINPKAEQPPAEQEG